MRKLLCLMGLRERWDFLSSVISVKHDIKSCLYGGKEKK